MDSKRKQQLAIRLGELCDKAGRCPAPIKWSLLAILAISNWLGLIFFGVVISE